MAIRVEGPIKRTTAPLEVFVLPRPAGASVAPGGHTIQDQNGNTYTGATASLLDNGIGVRNYTGRTLQAGEWMVVELAETDSGGTGVAGPDLPALPLPLQGTDIVIVWRGTTTYQTAASNLPGGEVFVAPVLSTAVVPSAGTTIILTYDEALLTTGDGVPGVGDYTITASGGACTVASLGVSGSAVTLTLSRTINIGETVTLDYTGGGSGRVQDSDGNIAVDLADQAVTNDSTQVGYTAVAVQFDGTNDYLSRGGVWSGAADGKVGIVSLWFNMQGGDSFNQYFVLTQASTLARFYVARINNNLLRVFGRNSAGTTILQAESTSTFSTSSNTGWHHLLVSWNLATPVVQMYIDDTGNMAGSPTTTDDSIAHSTGINAVTVGANVSATDKLNAYIAELYVNIAETMDFTVEANRRKFISADDKPVNLGADGSTPTGNDPIIYLANATASWHTNLGYGGGFTENGEIITAASSPSD